MSIQHGEAGIVYIAAGDASSTKRAEELAHEVWSRLPGIRVALATAGSTASQEASPPSGTVLALPRDDAVTAWSHVLCNLPFEKALLLAPDAYVAGTESELLRLFELLDFVDLALPRSPSMPGVGAGHLPSPFFPQVDPGVMLVRRDARLTPLVTAVQSCATESPAVGAGEHPTIPEVPFAHALAQVTRSRTDLVWTLLPPECSCHFELAGTLMTPPVILRGEGTLQRLSWAAGTLREATSRGFPVVHLASQVLRSRDRSIELVATTIPAREPSCNEAFAPERLSTFASSDATPEATTSRHDELGDRDVICAPLVYVIGMHRSGTSAVAGLLSSMGLSVLGAGDLMKPDYWNPRGYFESKTMQDVNDKLLSALGGTWSSPPILPVGWHLAREDMNALLPSLSQIVANLAPRNEPTVWKDPRLCLTLPLWRRAVDRPQAAVLVYRHPAEVASSLHVRDAIHPAQGLELWELYNRSALSALEGMRVAVVRYEDLVADPANSSDTIASLLSMMGNSESLSIPGEQAVAFIDAGLRREHSDRTRGANVLLPSHADLLDVLDSMRGLHASWRVPQT